MTTTTMKIIINSPSISYSLWFAALTFTFATTYGWCRPSFKHIFARFNWYDAWSNANRRHFDTWKLIGINLLKVLWFSIGRIAPFWYKNIQRNNRSRDDNTKSGKSFERKCGSGTVFTLFICNVQFFIHPLRNFQ